MNFIDYQNDVAAGFDFRDQRLHTAFKLTTELGTCHQGSQIQQENFLIPQLIGHITCCNTLSKALRDGSFTNTGFTDQTGIVLLTAVQNLNHPLRLHISADHLIQGTGLGSTGQIHAVGIQELMLIVFLSLRCFRFFLLFLFGGCLGGKVSKKLIHHGEGCSTAVRLFIVRFRLTGHAEHTAHLIRQGIQVFFRETHLLYHIVDLRNTQATGTAQAITLIHGNAVFHLCDEHNSDILLALGTQFRLHTHHYLSWGKSVCGRIPQTDK